MGAAADEERHRAYVRQWQETGLLLAALRREERAALTDEEALAAAHDVLEALDVVGYGEPRPSSGLVEMQRLLHRGRAT